MKITIESTDQIVAVKGRPARLWRGVTSKGIGCNVYVAAVSVELECNAADFEADLNAIDIASESDENELASPEDIYEVIAMIGKALEHSKGRWPKADQALRDLSSAFVDLAPLAPAARSKGGDE
jgi:hypothetical protein